MKKYDFCKIVGKNNLNTLRNDFGIDIQNLDVSENFKGLKYKKEEMENDLFLFFKGDKLLGMLIGNTRNKEYDSFERYCGEFDRYPNNKLARNRKNYTEIATDIIRIKKSDRQLKMKERIYCRPVTAKQDLKKRLEIFKQNKYNSITHERIIKISTEVAAFISKNLFMEMPVEYKKIKWFSVDGYPGLLKAFADDVKDYQNSYKEFENLKKRFGDKYVYDRNSILSNIETNYRSNKVEIIKWYNTLIK